jgi:acid phosphatase type 7
VRRTVVLLAVAFVAFTQTAAADLTNLVSNGDFEGSGSGSLAGWGAQNGTLSLATGDGGGFGGQLTWTSGTSFGITSTTKPVRKATQAGAVYTATGRFNAKAGATICLKVSESGSQTATGQSCGTGTGGWATLPQLDFTALANSDTLTLKVVQTKPKPVSGDSFIVDNLALTAGGGGGGGGVASPTNLTAQAVSTSEIDLSWDASTTGDVTTYHVFRDGGSQPIATVDAPVTKYQDTSLQPGTQYSYTVTAVNPTGESAASNSATATTQTQGGAVTIAAAGDVACNPNDPDYNHGVGTGSHCKQAATASLIMQGSYAKVLALGDLQYDCGSLGAFSASYDASWGQFVSKTLPVPGNHEVDTSSAFGETGCSKDATGYFTYFANHGVTEAAGVNGKGYYSYDLGSWHVLAINAECNQIGGCDAGSAEEAWVRADLAAHSTQCTLAYWHQAPWASAPQSTGTVNMRRIWADLANAGAELVLAGHFHYYERFSDMDANGNPVPSGTGTREIIAGVGGENQGGFNPTPLAASQVRKQGFGAVALTLGDGTYSWQYLQVGGATADSGTESCH